MAEADHLNLRYGEHVDFDRPVVVVEYGDALVGYLIGTVEGEEEGDNGVTVRLRCDAADLGRLLFLLDILSPKRGLSASHLVGEVEQVAWGGAALDSSAFLTPWLEVGPKFDTHLATVVPKGRQLLITPSLFDGLPKFFNLVGGALFGRGGYGGRDLNGFEEVIIKLSSLDDRFSVYISDQERCRRSANTGIGPGFFDEVVSILKPFLESSR